MFSKIKKYVIGFFVLLGGTLIAFFSGTGAGRKEEKIGKLDDSLKSVKKDLKAKKKLKNGVKKTLKSKKNALEEIKKQREQFGVERKPSDEAAEFLKKYAKKDRRK